jgi:cytochrome c
MPKLKIAAGIILLLASLPAVATAEDAAASVLDGIFTEEQVARGEAVYKEDCATCHAASLRGTFGAPGIIGARFNRTWVGMTVGDLYTFVHDTMPAGMGGTLSDKEYVDVVAYILSKQKYPAGEEELPADPDVLAQIAIVEAP